MWGKTIDLSWYTCMYNYTKHLLSGQNYCIINEFMFFENNACWLGVKTSTDTLNLDLSLVTFHFLYHLYFFFACRWLLLHTLKVYRMSIIFYKTCFYWVRIMCFNWIKHLLLWTSFTEITAIQKEWASIWPWPS